MKVLCEALFTRKRFTVTFVARMGMRGWVAVQLIALAKLICRGLVAFDEGEG